MQKDRKSEWRKPDFEIIGFDPQDIITTSVPGGGGIELPGDRW